MLLTQEHYDLLSQFEREFRGRHDKEDKSLWRIGQIYQSGEVNALFKAYRQGYSLGKSIAQQEAALAPGCGEGVDD